jgi:hypothetical protein
MLTKGEQMSVENRKTYSGEFKARVVAELKSGSNTLENFA